MLDRLKQISILKPENPMSYFESEEPYPIRVERYRGNEIMLHAMELAQLRSEVFYDWPYLFDGWAAGEQKDIARFAASEQSLMVAAYDDKTMVGATTAAPLMDYFPIFATDFNDAGYPPKEVFYFAESLLMEDYRGMGLGHMFFDEREEHAASLGYKYASFAVVMRPQSHPRRPKGARTHDVFWKKRGYAKAEGLVSPMVWLDRDNKEPDAKPMQFWIKELS
jgi:GNAT superfamily N-acetyltransferase